jgi:hypothetical protein
MQQCSQWPEAISILLLPVMQQQEVQGRWEEALQKVPLQARSAWQQLLQNTQQELCQMIGRLRLTCRMRALPMCGARVTRMHQQQQQVVTWQLIQLMWLQQMQQVQGRQGMRGQSQISWGRQRVRWWAGWRVWQMLLVLLLVLVLALLLVLLLVLRLAPLLALWKVLQKGHLLAWRRAVLQQVVWRVWQQEVVWSRV